MGSKRLSLALKNPVAFVHTKPAMPPQEIDKRQAAREVIDILHEIATLLVRSRLSRRSKNQTFAELIGGKWGRK